MTARIAGTLTPDQIQQQLKQGDAIAKSASIFVLKNEFVFLAGFDGTNNDRNNLLAGEQSTNVAQLISQAESASSPNVGANYYIGPGTTGTLPGSSFIPSQVTQEGIVSATRAYKDFQQQASIWLNEHPDGSVATAITAFSRGVMPLLFFPKLFSSEA